MAFIDRSVRWTYAAFYLDAKSEDARARRRDWMELVCMSQHAYDEGG